MNESHEHSSPFRIFDSTFAKALGDLRDSRLARRFVARNRLKLRARRFYLCAEYAVIALRLVELLRRSCFFIEQPSRSLVTAASDGSLNLEHTDLAAHFCRA